MNPTQGTAPRLALAGPRVHRFEVRPSPAAGDPLGRSIQKQAAAIGLPVTAVRTARLYLVEAEIAPDQVERLRTALFADPVLESASLGAAPARLGDQIIEVLPLPGVMDPAAQTVEHAILDLLSIDSARAATGIRYDVEGLTREQADTLARRLLANPVIEAVHRAPFIPSELAAAHAAHPVRVRQVGLRALTDDQLNELSRAGHLFLSLAEMQAIRAHYQSLNRDPTDIELETLAQTWSEHCVHKTLKSNIVYKNESGGLDPINWSNRPGHEVRPDGSVVVHNLLKSTVAAATHELIAGGLDWALSVFKDNSGVIAFDDQHAVCIKVETHNHPSAIEPYGGAATGIGGCIRDVMGTGLGAKPIASTDVFCVAPPDMKDVPPGCLHPHRVLTRVVDGIRDYGNRMGIPTVNGAVYFDERYVGNPLVFAGCIGVMPRDRIKGAARAGDLIIALGGRTGRDGIHGATFSSAELTDTHADEFSHAVQIGNAIEQKRTLDAILRARDYSTGGAALPLFTAITDCGAGGFSSAVGEMGAELGATVQLERAPLKYRGLRYDEIWISESQERMILAVPPANLAALKQICREEGVELCELGTFGTPRKELILRHGQTEVGRLSMDFLHDGIPMPTREAVWNGSDGATKRRGDEDKHSEELLSASQAEDLTTAEDARARDSSDSSSPPSLRRFVAPSLRETLLSLLAHPNIASKRWVVRQYDHEVQGNTVIKPLVGPGGIGPGDATVIQPVPGSKQGLAIACGMAVPLGDVENGGDPYLMALASVDECVRNLVCVGADPSRIAILDNFCWPSCEKPRNLASLVRAAEGCYDAAKAYKTPFVSGKDSLNNQFRYKDPATGREITIEIPPTLLITGIGIVPDVTKCVTMDIKSIAEDTCVVVIEPAGYWTTIDHDGRIACAANALTEQSVACAHFVAHLIETGIALAVHDCSDGGILVGIAEMLVAAERDGQRTRGVFARLPDVLGWNIHSEQSHWHRAFSDGVGRYLVQMRSSDVARAMDHWIQFELDFNERAGMDLSEAERLAFINVGEDMRITDRASLELQPTAGPERIETIPVSDLRRAFLGTLDW